MANSEVPPTVVRPDELGWPDDIVVQDCDVHLERMNDNSWWMGCYRGDKRITFWFGSTEDIRVVVGEDELGAVNDNDCGEVRDGHYRTVRAPAPYVQPDEGLILPEYNI